MDADPGLAIELARDAMRQIAPDELPLFEVTSEIYRADPSAVETAGQLLAFAAIPAALGLRSLRPTLGSAAAAAARLSG